MIAPYPSQVHCGLEQQSFCDCREARKDDEELERQGEAGQTSSWSRPNVQRWPIRRHTP